MSEYAIMPYSDYQNACNAIREKTGTTDFIKSGDMAGLIDGIKTGSGEDIVETCRLFAPYSSTQVSFSYTNANNEIVTGTFDGTVHEILKNSMVVIHNYIGNWILGDIQVSVYYIISGGFGRELLISSSGAPIAFIMEKDLEFGYIAADNEPE